LTDKMTQSKKYFQDCPTHDWRSLFNIGMISSRLSTRNHTAGNTRWVAVGLDTDN